MISEESPADTVPTDSQTPFPAQRQRKSSRASIGRSSTYQPESPTAAATNRPRLRTSDIGELSPSKVPEIFSSWSTSSDKQLGYASSEDRVFPIRSVVSVDAGQAPPMTPALAAGDTPGSFSLTGPTGTGPSPTAESSHRNPRTSSEYNSAPSSAHEQRKSVEFQNATWPSGTQISESRRVSADNTKHRRNTGSTTRSDSLFHGGKGMHLFSTASSDKSTGRGENSSTQGIMSTNKSAHPQGSLLSGSEDNNRELVTARFKHVVTKDGHAIITGRDGDTLQRCEDEPIHIPGAVQGFGVLVALKEEAEGQLVVRIASENAGRIIGHDPQELFRLHSFTDILSEEQADNLLDHIDFIRDDEADPASNGPEVFTISIRTSKRKTTKLWCAVHMSPTDPDLVICEFELDDDRQHPLVPVSDETPEPPEDTLNNHPTDEEFAESTQNASKPLRVLRNARKRRGEAAAMEVFNILSQVQEQLAAASSLDSFLKILVGVVKELTGFHRVMIYQFDSSFNGRVVTELVDPRATKDLYKGLNFPASDIPKQARDLYKVNKVRLLYDRDLETARLVCRTVEDLETPLDLTYSYLRAMSPIHIKYLANMAVRSSMSISINAFNELWGLISCHSYGSRGMRVSFPIRKMCRLIGDTASRNIERLSYASRLQARKLINTVPTDRNPSGYIIATSDDLLKLFDADFGILSIRGETKILGRLEHSQEALAMLEYLRLRKITSVMTSQDIREDFPDLRYPPGFNVIAGLLLVPLSIGGTDFIVFLRKSQVREVKWAGNPYEKFIREGTEGYLEPRQSFKVWSETIVGKCREWTEEQIETAAVLCLVYGKFIEVWRQKEAVVQSSQLTRLLLANSAHEVRTPLNAIINYLEIALEGNLDQETRENLAKSHSASKSLIYVINDLLDLTKTEQGLDLIKYDSFDLPATIRSVAEMFRGDAKRKGLEYELVVHPGIPQMVTGDQRRVRQIVTNITTNAIQNTSNGAIMIEVWLADQQESTAIVEISVQDSGAGMSSDRLDALFRELEEVSKDTGDFFDSDEITETGEVAQERTLGLGLALVARIVRNMEGQLRLKSEEGKGSRFVVQLPFELADDGQQTGEMESFGSNKGSSFERPSLHTPPPIPEGEVTLIDKASPMPKSERTFSSRRSVDGIVSLKSEKTGSSVKTNRSGGSAKSEVDRLIDAISEPLAMGTPESEEMRLRRSNSVGMQSVRSTHSREDILASDQLPSDQSGSQIIQDTKTLLRAVKVPEEYDNVTSDDQSQPTSRVLFDFAEQPKKSSPKKEAPRQQTADHLQILVAEDDPVNSRIIQKRLEKLGHTVYPTINGEECATAYGEKAAFFDVVLMDIQMPIVDGVTATKMIRSHEKTYPESILSPRAKAHGRIPIFAVSASLVERDRDIYVNAGFDGWVLKPIDFKRLNILLTGIVDEKTRMKCLYQPGINWEQGGWFGKQQPGVLKARTSPSTGSPIANPPVRDSLQPEDVSSSEASTPKINSVDGQASSTIPDL